MVKKLVLITSLIFLILLGLLGVYQLHVQHNVELYLSIPWRLLVATYLFLVSSGLSLCIVVFLAEFFKKARSIVDEVLILSLVMIIVGLAVIAIDLDRLERAGYAVLGHANYKSLMFWLIMFYVIEVLLLLFGSWFHFRNRLLEKKDLISRIIVISRRIFTDEKKNYEIAKTLNFFAFLTAILVYIDLGFLYAIEDWHSPFLFLFFVATALVTAFSLALVIAVVHRKFVDVETLKYGFGFSIAVYTVFLMWRIFAGIYSSYFSEEIVMFYFRIPSFWITEIFIGLLIPIIIIVTPASRNYLALFLAAVAALLGIFFQRINLVYTKQESMLISGIKFSPQIFLFEILILIGALALVSLIYYILREVVR